MGSNDRQPEAGLIYVLAPMARNEHPFERLQPCLLLLSL